MKTSISLSYQNNSNSSLTVLYQLQRNGNCWPFLEPVTRDIAPDYFDVIEKPMDISELRRKSSKKLYSSKQQFIDDFNLIVDNCTKYNGETSGKWSGMDGNCVKNALKFKCEPYLIY